MITSNILETAKKYEWSSVTYILNQERISLLRKFLIGHTILEAGCGGGAYVDYFSKIGLNVTGVDLSLDLLYFSKNSAFTGTFINADVSQLPFKDNSFDCSYALDILEHIDDTKGFAELQRVTKKRIIFSVPQEDKFFKKYGLVPFSYQDNTHLRYYSYDRVNKLATLFPYKKLKIISEGHFPLESLFTESRKSKVNTIEDILIPSIRGNSKFIKLYNKKIFKYILSAFLRIFINERKLEVSIFKNNYHREIYSGWFVIVDLLQ